MKEYWNDLTNGQKTKLILKIVLVILALIFAIRNWQSVNVHFVFFSSQIPITLIIVLSGAIGFGMASIFDYRKFKVKNKEITELKTKLTATELTETK